MIRYGLAWGPAAIWLGVLFVLSAQPDSAVPSWWQINDTVAHLGLYAVLGGALAWGRFLCAGRPSRLVLLALGVLWALSDEWHQTFVPGRTASGEDLLADGVGLFLGLSIVSRALPLLLADVPLPFLMGTKARHTADPT